MFTIYHKFTFNKSILCDFIMRLIKIFKHYLELFSKLWEREN